VARFRQVKREQPHVHHDALEFPDGQIVLLNSLCQGQQATVLQLPIAPRTPEEAGEQKRVAVVARAPAGAAAPPPAWNGALHPSSKGAGAI
jgi:hypothetical protein